MGLIDSPLADSCEISGVSRSVWKLLDSSFCPSCSSILQIMSPNGNIFCILFLTLKLDSSNWEHKVQVSYVGTGHWSLANYSTSFYVSVSLSIK